MKTTIKKLFYFSLTFTMALFFSSCEKEEFANETKNSSNLTISNGDIEIVEYTIGTNPIKMLKFDSQDHFLSTIEQLRNQADKYDDTFLKRWNHLGDEELDAKEDELGYDDHQPYIDFESQFPEYKSLREDISEREEIWLNTPTLIDELDPDDHFVFDDEVRAVLNVQAQVQISNDIYQMTRFGYIVFDNVASFLTVSFPLPDDYPFPGGGIHGTIYGGTPSGNNTSTTDNSECRTNIDNRQYYYPTSSRRIKAVQKLKGYTQLWGSKIKAKTKHYKKRGGRWKKRRGNITAAIGGNSRNVFCENPNLEHETKSRRRKKVKVTIKAPSSSEHSYKTKRRKLKTIHKRDNTTYNYFFYE